MSPSLVKKSTPVLFVDAIEPSCAFWEDKLGFTRTLEVSIGAALCFAAFSNETVEIMHQTFASAAEDAPFVGARERHGRTFLFIEVTDIDAVERALAGCQIVLPRRQTFYGSTEIGYREPGGDFVTFAQFPS